jgi:hypothetical protein
MSCVGAEQCLILELAIGAASSTGDSNGLLQSQVGITHAGLAFKKQII